MPCSRQFNWTTLGLDPDKVVLTAPYMEGFQNATQWKVTDTIPVIAEKGYAMLVHEGSAPKVKEGGVERNKKRKRQRRGRKKEEMA